MIVKNKENIEIEIERIYRLKTPPTVTGIVSSIGLFKNKLKNPW